MRFRQARPPTARSRQHRRAGYSLIELIAVMLLLSIVAGMAAPRLNFEKYRADAAMRSVRVALQGAQRNSIMRQTNVVVAFDVAGRRLLILEDTNNDCVRGGGERMNARPLEEGTRLALPPTGLSGTVSTPVVSVDPCQLNGFPTVQFLRDGAASTDLEVYVTSSRGQPTDFRAVRITKATARADSYRHNGTAWVRMN